ncbi:glycoside hydrolase family 31 protein [Aeromicrobium massiliense]|uniref:glycoside hydrolase family 31 protein n=1 Tax=Aeromicrobium massiliense TaxID=1464554 RepID=UPI0002E68EDD|nr:TIM-barrel domain-containing protein [Aeromicrobium massiliense]
MTAEHEVYRIPTSPVAAPEAVVQGETFRITVLADGLVRLEHAADGRFEDRASAFALHRRQPVPEFDVRDGDVLEIVTARLHLTYDKRPFSTSGLSVQVRGGVSNYHSVWRYGEDVPDLGGTARTLDKADGEIDLEPGVVSRWGYAVIDDSATPVLTDDGWVEPRDGTRQDVYVFAYGLDHREAVKALYAVSGGQPLLPRYALGNWWSRYYAYSADEYRALMERFEAERVPLSVAVLDMDWHHVDVDPVHGSGWTGYSWNRDLFPDPQGFLDDLHARGLHVTLNVHPADGVRQYEDAYVAVAQALGHDPAAGAPVAFDVTDREFVRAYFDLLHRPLEDQGVDFWWIDWQSGPYSRVAGLDPLWMLNHLHFLDNARGGQRPLTFSRYAGPGSHRYPVGFSGDSVISWDSLAFQPYFTSTASNIGFGWWSHDVGGHYGGRRDDELATRWVQLGVLSPITRLHSSNNPFNSKEPWRFNLEARQVMSTWLRHRHRLLPYLHTMNHRAAREGEPLVQPLYWEHPDVDDAYDLRNTYLFGSELLVAPITSPRDTRTMLGSVTAWLPPGTWVDVITGQVYDGDRRLELHRDLWSIPVLARSGAIVPLDADPSSAGATDNPATLEVCVVAGADGRFVLVEDDGRGDGMDESGVARTELVWDQASGTLTIGAATGATHCMPAERTWRLRLLGTDQVVGVGPHTTTEPLTVSVGDDPRPRDARIGERLFELLDRAQIPFDVKQRVHAVAMRDMDAGVRMAHLGTLGLPPALLSAVGEMLLASP